MLNMLIDVPIDAVALQRLRELPDVRAEVIPYREQPEPLPAELINDKHVIFCTFPPSNIEACTALQWIQIGSVGYNQLVGFGLGERGIRASNAQGVFDVPIAEWNIAMMFQLARDMRQYADLGNSSGLCRAAQRAHRRFAGYRGRRRISARASRPWHRVDGQHQKQISVRPRQQRIQQRARQGADGLSG